MASITKKIINGHPYYYARESKRIDGKPKIVWQKYLGKIEDIVEAVERKGSPTLPDEVIISHFGAVAALYDIACRWGLAEIIDRVADKRNQGLSVGNYMQIAAINRSVCPKSKRRMGEWFIETPLRRWIDVGKNALSSQRFWDNMAHLDAETIRRAERDLTEAVVEKFNVDTRCLLYDTTNFATFIDTFNENNTLAQRGNSKQKRSDLRIVGLALLVSADFHIPLFHEVYQGNTHDSREFESVVERLVERHRVISKSLKDLTLIFDKGNNSVENMGSVESSPYHFVGSLKLNQVEDLLDISIEDYEELTHPRLSGVKSYRVQRNVYGMKRTLLLTYNEELFLTQNQTLFREIRKCIGKLKKLASQLSRWTKGEVKKGKRPTLSGVRKNLNQILKGQYIKQVICTELNEDKGFPALSYRVDHEALKRVIDRRFGKTVLFTDNDSWSDTEITLAYRGQYRVEEAFRTMKNPHFVSWSPMWHWTDHNIRVHAFYCVLALTLASLLQRELHSQGIEISISGAIEELSGISEVALVKKRKKGKQPEPQIVISRMNATQQRMFDALQLSRYSQNESRSSEI